MKLISDNHRKAQAAMEFLMTYGWAILVVLAAIAALAYFGVLSPEKFLPEKCLIEVGFTCITSKVTPSDATIIFSNGLGKSVLVTSITMGSCSGTFNTSILSGNEARFDMSGCDNGDLKETFKGDILIKYTEKSTGLTKTSYGNIATKIEEP